MRIHLDVVQGRGQPQAVAIDAASFDDARQQLVSQGYTVLAMRAEGLDWRRLFANPRAPAQRFDVTVFVEQVRDLLAAGLSVIEALTTLRQVAGTKSRSVLDPLVERLHNGERLSQALAADVCMPALLVALVRASEHTSNLPQALTRFLEHEQRVAELRHRIASVAIYPLLLTGVGASVLMFLLLYVMPRFARVFEGMNGPLPWSARAMVWWAQWLASYGSWLFGLSAILAVVAIATFMSPAARGRILQKVLDWSPLRERLRTYFLARWYRATGMLVEGGIPLPQALALSNSLLPLALQRGGMAVERALQEGYSPAQSHVQAGMATPVAEQLMRAGERTGDFGNVLLRIAQFHDAEVARSIERGMRTLEPLVMILIGVGVGVVVVLMYMPIFELASAIQ